jgi:hypothetical protein
VIKFVTEESD